MIAFITGKLLDRLESGCIVLTDSGIGYAISLTEREILRLPSINELVKFYVFHVIREDSQTLFGFSNISERISFSVLLGISKLGPKTAQAIINKFTPHEIAKIIFANDLVALSSVQGIGIKSAQRILLDLKDKANQFDILPETEKASINIVHNLNDDVSQALVSLGYAPFEVKTVVKSVFEEEPDLDVETALRKCLKKMARR